MTINEFRDFTFENYYKRIGFSKENSYSIKYQKKDLQLFATTLTGKIPDPSHAKEYYNSYFEEKKTQNQ